MRADQISSGPHPDRRQPQTALQGEINPVGQRGLQLDKRFPLGLANGDQTVKSWNTRGETFVLAEKSDLRELESLPTIFVHRLHVGTVLQSNVPIKALRQSKQLPVRLLGFPN